jgi:hypothetical protein
MPLDKASSKSPIFSAREFDDEDWLVAMDLLLDACMQWFHIGSYLLAGRFFSAGWVGASHWQAFTCSDVSAFQSMVMCREPPWVMEEVFMENSRGLLSADCSR